MVVLQTEMLPAIANEEGKVMSCLSSAYIEEAKKGKLPIRFELGRFFTALWSYGNYLGLSLPNNSDFNKDFKEFCDQLMNPWPIRAFENAGIKIKHIHSSNSKFRHKYEISHT